MTFMERVKEMKDEKKMTTNELAVRAGVPVGTLNKLLTGVTEEPRLSVAAALAEALEASLDLLCGTSAAARGCLARDEERLVDCYRVSSDAGKDMILTVAEKELMRATEEEATQLRAPIDTDDKILLPLFLLPVSAGRGAILDSSDAETIAVKSNRITVEADFALRVSGDSMEPKFHNGDTLLVKQKPSVEKGEYGIFIADGEGYFKCFLGDTLHSLNPKYADMPIKDFKEFICCGKVIGRIPVGHR